MGVNYYSFGGLFDTAVSYLNTLLIVWLYKKRYFVQSLSHIQLFVTP